MATSRRFWNFDPWPVLQPSEGLGLTGAGGQKIEKIFFLIFFIFSTDNAKGMSLLSEKPKRNNILTFLKIFYVVIRKKVILPFFSFFFLRQGRQRFLLGPLSISSAQYCLVHTHTHTFIPTNVNTPIRSHTHRLSVHWSAQMSVYNALVK